jgi:RNA polymerase sigma factor (TIGR02999 family)
MSTASDNLPAIAGGDELAASSLLPGAYEELRRMAAARMVGEAAGHTLQATALVHEAWMRLQVENGRAWQSRAHFFGAASEAMRRILVESARKRACLKRGGNPLRVELEDYQAAATMADEKLLSVHEALTELETLNSERARVVVMKFFAGLTNLEVAETLGISERSVNRHWLCAKAWLGSKMRNEGREI